MKVVSVVFQWSSRLISSVPIFTNIDIYSNSSTVLKENRADYHYTLLKYLD